MLGYSLATSKRLKEALPVTTVTSLTKWEQSDLGVPAEPSSFRAPQRRYLTDRVQVGVMLLVEESCSATR